MIVVGTTLAAYKMGADPGYWGAWISHAEEMAELNEVKFFAAIELDARGLEPFEPLINRLLEVEGEWWTFHLDDGRTEIQTGNRLRHIAFGQNLITEYMLTTDATHVLVMGADVEPPADTIPKLLEMDWPLVGGDIPDTYGINGPVIEAFGFPVMAQMPTGAFHLIRRDLARVLRWRWDLESGFSDDAALYSDAFNIHRLQAYVRKDVVGRHHPTFIYPVEDRGHDREIRR